MSKMCANISVPFLSLGEGNRLCCLRYYGRLERHCRRRGCGVDSLISDKIADSACWV